MAVQRKEYFLSLDNFNQPAKLEGKEAEALLLARLILMEKGTNPLHPEMGCSLQSKYRHGANNLSQLRQEIQAQINEYLPDFANELAVELVITPDKILNIEIATLDGTVYIFDTNLTEGTLDDVNN